MYDVIGTEKTAGRLFVAPAAPKETTEGVFMLRAKRENFFEGVQKVPETRRLPARTVGEARVRCMSESQKTLQSQTWGNFDIRGGGAR